MQTQVSLHSYAPKALDFLAPCFRIAVSLTSKEIQPNIGSLLSSMIQMMRHTEVISLESDSESDSDSENDRLAPTRREIIEIESEDDRGSADESLGLNGEDFLALNDGAERGFNSGQDEIAAIHGPGQAQEIPGRLIGASSFDDVCHEVVEVFPDISLDHVRQLYDARVLRDNNLGRAGLAQDIILEILDGKTYPKEKDSIREKKRKRSQDLDSDEEEAARWRAVDRGLETVYFDKARRILSEEFPSVPLRFVENMLREKGNLYAAYLVIELEEYQYLDNNDRRYTRLKTARKPKFGAPKDMSNDDVPELLQEVEAARTYREKEQAKRRIVKDAAEAEALTDQEYRDNGDVMDCQCCFDSYTINKVTHCDGDEPHFFCLECAERNAKNEIGNSRYQLKCMDFSGCKASFSREQKLRFLDEKSFEALERIQQQAEILQAEFENLHRCPFCDFAAICPPVDVDKEFRCRNPECEKVSCRLCKLDSHLPLTCEESKKENGISERHVVEEARTDALLRTCPKCKVKILKEDGCNKVTCTCGGMLCDYCGKDISKEGYAHFDGRPLHGHVGAPTTTNAKKCPTYDNFLDRRNKELDKAETQALEKVRAENPDIRAEDLKIKFKDAAKSPPRRHAVPAAAAPAQIPVVYPYAHHYNPALPLHHHDPYINPLPMHGRNHAHAHNHAHYLHAAGLRNPFPPVGNPNNINPPAALRPHRPLPIADPYLPPLPYPQHIPQQYLQHLHHHHHHHYLDRRREIMQRMEERLATIHARRGPPAGGPGGGG